MLHLNFAEHFIDRWIDGGQLISDSLFPLSVELILFVRVSVTFITADLYVTLFISCI